MCDIIDWARARRESRRRRRGFGKRGDLLNTNECSSMNSKVPHHYTTDAQRGRRRFNACGSGRERGILHIKARSKELQPQCEGVEELEHMEPVWGGTVGCPDQKCHHKPPGLCVLQKLFSFTLQHRFITVCKGGGRRGWRGLWRRERRERTILM